MVMTIQAADKTPASAQHKRLFSVICFTFIKFSILLFRFRQLSVLVVNFIVMDANKVITINIPEATVEP